MNDIDLSNLTARERKIYAEGMALVESKRQEARQASVDRKAATAKQNADIAIKKMGADLAKKCFGVSAQVSKPAKPLPANTRKALSSIPDEKQGVSYHFFSVSHGMKQNARRLARNA